MASRDQRDHRQLIDHQESQELSPRNSFTGSDNQVSKFYNEESDPTTEGENVGNAEDIPDGPDGIVTMIPSEVEGSLGTSSVTTKDGISSTTRSRSNFFSDSQNNAPLQDERGQLNLLSAAYESLDYDTCMNSVLLDEERTKGYTFVIKKDMMRWLVVFFVATFTALVACGIDITIESLSKYKYSLLSSYTNECARDNCLAIPFFLWGALNIGPVLVAAFLGSYVEPMAAGSGIPQVKCYLNGVKIPRVVRIKTLLCKGIGVTFSVLGGLAVGKEGPMIHSGAVIAAGMSQGKTTSLKRDFGLFEYFREDHEKRDFVSAGAAAGVAAAFGAPVGGVLFSLEEGASFWNQSLTWRVFFGAMVSVFMLNLVLSTYHNHPGKLNFNGLINFGKFEDLNYEIWEFIPFILMGVLGGLLGALYNHINYKLTVFRMRYIHKPWQKILEAAFVALITALTGFLMIYLSPDCRPVPEEHENYPITAFCGNNEESAVAAIWFQTPEKSVRSLFHDIAGSYNAYTLVIFFGCYFLLACWTYGLGIPSGLFIPTLLAGAAQGRLVGMLMRFLFPNQSWVDEGKYALVGAGALLGGVVRMTLSLTVILMEAVGNITFGLPLMIVLMVAKWVGDYFNEGLYDIHIQMLGVPIMAWEPPPLSNNIYASEFMNRPVTSFRAVEKVSRIVAVLKTCTYNGFPVVDDLPGSAEDDRYFKSFGRLRGFILRSQLVVLLKNKVFNENADVWLDGKVDIHMFRLSYPRYFTMDQVEISPEEMEYTVDLRPFMNPSPYAVISCTALPRIFSLFRALGLRHLVVVNDSNEVVGMVTRKDLVKYRVWKHRGQMGLEELVIYNSV